MNPLQQHNSGGDSSRSAEQVTLTVTFRKQVHVLDHLPPNTTIAEIRHVLQHLTLVPASNQKLLASRSKGSRIADLNHLPSPSNPEPPNLANDARTLTDVGLGNGGEVRIMLVGTPSTELETIQSQEAYDQKRNGPRNYHPSMLRGNKPQNTSSASPTCPFGNVRPHSSTPSSSSLYNSITNYLTRLANDPGILHICRLHNFRVGLLTELLPWESPHLLGLNQNAGQIIYLRIRTDDAEGLRDYHTTRRVLVHELAHNKVADHPPEFKILNSQLNAQIDTFENKQRQGTHSFIQGDVYMPLDSDRGKVDDQDDVVGLGTLTDSHIHILGGSNSNHGNPPSQTLPLSTEERRKLILIATMKRLEREEQEIELGCGSANASK